MKRTTWMLGVLAVIVTALMVGTAVAPNVSLGTSYAPAHVKGSENPVAAKLSALSEKANASINRTSPAIRNLIYGSEGRSAVAKEPDSVLSAAVASLLGPYAPMAANITPAEWQFIKEVVSTGHVPRNATIAGSVDPAVCVNCVLGSLITVGGLGVVVYVCGIATFATAGVAGLACGVAIAAVAIVYVVYNFICPISNFFGSTWGCARSPGSEDSAAAIGLAKLLVSEFGTATNIQAVAEQNLVQVLNLTQDALGYEVAAASLTQLGNTSYNGALAMTQSGVAQQLASVFYADSTTLATIFATVAADANKYEGATNTLGYYCPIYLPAASGPIGAELAVPGGTGTSCGGTSPSSFQYLYGLYVGSWWPLAAGSGSFGTQYGFIQKGSSMAIYSYSSPGPAVVTFTPVDNKSAATVLTIPLAEITAGNYVAENVSLSVLAGGNGAGYAISATPAAASLYFNFFLPLTSNTLTALGSNGPAGVLQEQPTTLPSNAVGEAGGIAFAGGYTQGAEISQSGSPTYEASMYGKNTNTTMAEPRFEPNLFQEKIGSYLFTLAQIADRDGNVYWTYLHFILGYTSISQVPAKCIILSPSQILPPNIEQSTLETMNTTTLLNWYAAALAELGRTFNDNVGNINATTICGAHVKWNGGNVSVGFGIYGVGYIYIPTATKSSDGKVDQVFSDPKTWNLSGEFYIAPSVGSLAKIPVNTTFSLPSANGVTFFVQPFLTTTADNLNGLITNRTGPSFCITHQNAVGCETNSLYNYLTTYEFGNSTAGGGVTGAPYPLSCQVADPASSCHIGTSLSTKTAVYLTGCYVAKNGSSATNASYKQTNLCKFNILKVNNTAYVCNGTILLANGVPIGKCAGGGGGVLVSSGDCNIIFVSSLDTAISPHLGEPWSCVAAWLVVVVIVIVVIYVLVQVVESAGRKRRMSG